MKMPTDIGTFIVTVSLLLSLTLFARAEEPEAIVPVRALINAMAVEDAELIRTLFSPHATQAYGAAGQMKSAEATARWLESDIIARKGKVANPEFIANGHEVVVRGQFTSVGYSSKADFLFTVESGLITSWRIRY